MRLETLFEKFDLFADTADAVAKMRELVLDLAIQGKLVERRASEDDGHTLLKKLRTLPPEQNSKSRSPKDITVEPEIPLEIPSHWALTTVENTTRETGFFSDGDWVESKDQDPAGDVRLIQLADVGDGQYRDRSSRFMTKEAAKRLNCSYLESGDILVARMPDPLGRCCRFPGDPKPAVTVVDVCILRSNVAFFDPDFLVVAINCPQFRRLVSAQATGTTRSRISRSNLSVLPIPLPPLAEQKRIVVKVDELMALCDRLEAQQQEQETRHATLARASLARFADAPTPANLDFIFHKSYDIVPADLRKSILTLAVQGKLVPQDPNDEPAEQFLAQIKSSKLRLQAAGRIGKDKPVNPVELDSLLFKVPESWCWTKLSEVTELITKGSSPKWQGITYVSGSEGILFITSENVGNYRLRKLDDLKYVEKRFNEIEPRSILKSGDILMNLVGASIGRSAVYDLHDGANINQAVALIRLVSETEGLCPSYLLHYLNSPFAVEYMLSSRVVNAQPNISLTDAREFAVPVPPLAEQRRIVVKVDELMALVDALETQLANSRTTAEKLMEAVVAELTA